ncbi:MAG: hypothetical protein KDD25_10195 [Bdellovibrionales bacterium]|nr:hypothetical protein [Bdellovibrionales bacterium]
MRYVWKLFLLLFISTLAMSCGKDKSKEKTKVIEVNEMAPYYVAVREDQNGNAEYASLNQSFSEEQAVQKFGKRSRSLNWRGISPSRAIDGEFPRSSKSNSLYFVENPEQDFDRIQSGTSGYHGHGQCGRGNYGYHIYYGYRSYNHCYPRHDNYYGWYYQPTFYWNRSFYYYQPVYRPFQYGYYNYYVYRAAWWW